MNINSLFVKTLRMNSELINYKIVRWRRTKKPFWLGLAKSKMFLISERKDFRDAEDRNEFMQLERHYNTQLKSLLNFIRKGNPESGEMGESGTSGGGDILLNPSLQNKMAESLKVNKMWNAESAKRRELRMKENKERNIKKAVEIIEAGDKIKKERMELIEEIVRKEKLLSETYITPENLDEAIENCLNKVETYDFAIDFQGNKYHGRETLQTRPNTIKTELSEESVV